MKKSFNFLVVITLVITFALTSCNNTDISLTTNTNSTTISSSTNTNSTTTSQHIHTFSSSYEYDGTYHWHPSTCGHDVQGDIEEHTFTEEIINPTYDSIGYTTYTCLTCGYSYTDDEVDKLEHNYSSTWSYNSSSHWHACTDEGYEHLKKDEGSHTFTTSITNPSYEHGGYTTYTCSVCGYSYTDDETNALPITITWKNYDGTILEVDNNVPYGTMPNYDGEIPTKESDALHYYTFEKWNPEIVSATSNATYVASYTQHECDSFIISYNANGGSGAPSSQTKPKGFTITLESTIPTYEGYTFVGWNNIYENTVYNAGSSFNLDLNVTLYAMWEKNCEHCNHTGTVTISSSCAFCWGSGKKCNSCGSTSVKQVVSQGYSYYQCNLCGSRSIGNCSSCGGSGKSTSTQTCSYCNGLKYEKDVSPTMSSIEPRRAVLDSISGYEYSIDGINFQSSPVFNNLKPHTSYSFYQRIATNGNKPFGCTSKPLTVSTPNATTYFVEYDLNGGINNTSNPSSYSTSGSSIPLKNPTREHYDFVGWTYNGSIVTSISPSWNEDITLVANWKTTEYSITYNLNGGSGDNPTTHGIETGSISLTEPTKNGYTFIGWTGSNGTEPSTDVTIEAGNTLIQRIGL